MKDTDKDLAEFSKVIVLTAEEFGGVPSDNNLILKFNALKKYSIEEIKKAGDWIVKNRKEKYPNVPTTNEFIKAIKQIDKPLMSLRLQAALQCDIVLKYAKTYGSGCTHIFKNNVTQYLMTNRWNFSELGCMSKEEVKWFRKDFVIAWEDMAQAATQIEKNSPLLLESNGKIAVRELKQLIVPKKLTTEEQIKEILS